MFSMLLASDDDFAIPMDMSETLSQMPSELPPAPLPNMSTQAAPNPPTPESQPPITYQTLGVPTKTSPSRKFDDEVQFVSEKPVKRRRLESTSTPQRAPQATMPQPQQQPQQQHPVQNSSSFVDFSGQDSDMIDHKPNMANMELNGIPGFPQHLETDSTARGSSLPAMDRYVFPTTFPSGPPGPACQQQSSPALSPKQLPETISPNLLQRGHSQPPALMQRQPTENPGAHETSPSITMPPPPIISSGAGGSAPVEPQPPQSQPNSQPDCTTTSFQDSQKLMPDTSQPGHAMNYWPAAPSQSQSQVPGTGSCGQQQVSGTVPPSPNRREDKAAEHQPKTDHQTSKQCTANMVAFSVPDADSQKHPQTQPSHSVEVGSVGHPQPTEHTAPTASSTPHQLTASGPQHGRPGHHAAGLGTSKGPCRVCAALRQKAAMGKPMNNPVMLPPRLGPHSVAGGPPGHSPQNGSGFNLVLVPAPNAPGQFMAHAVAGGSNRSTPPPAIMTIPSAHQYVMQNPQNPSVLLPTAQPTVNGNSREQSPKKDSASQFSPAKTKPVPPNLGKKPNQDQSGKHIIVDIAETASEFFPFAKVAKRHNMPLDKVKNIFEAVVAVPFLRVPTDKRRAGKLGQERVKAYQTMKKELGKNNGSQGSMGEAQDGHPSMFEIARTMGPSEMPSEWPHGFPGPW